MYHFQGESPDVRISSLYFGFSLTAEYLLEIPRRSLRSLCRNDVILGMAICSTCHPEEQLARPALGGPT